MAAAAQKPQNSSSNDIAALVATLASRQAQAQATAAARQLTGPERAAVLMLALGEQYGGKIWSMLDDDELRELSIVMSTIGTVEASSVESLLLEFVSRMSASGALMGNYDSTERLLQQYLPPERVGGIMKRSAAQPAATCGRSSPTCRKRCSPIISRTNIRKPSRSCCRN